MKIRRVFETAGAKGSLEVFEKENVPMKGGTVSRSRLLRVIAGCALLD